jgi:hypothetical protein
LPITIWCNNPKTKLVSIINHHESLKLVFFFMSYNYE